MVVVLLGVLGGWLRGGLSQEGKQSSGWRNILFYRISECGSNVGPFGEEMPAYMIDESCGTVRSLTVLRR